MLKIISVLFLSIFVLSSCVGTTPTYQTTSGGIQEAESRIVSAETVKTQTTPQFIETAKATIFPIATITPTNTFTVPQSVINENYWAIVSPNRAAFWFKVDPEISRWTWYNDPENNEGFEFEWGVEFPISGGAYQTYSTEVLLFYKDNVLPQSGTIIELLSHCDSGLWVIDRGGMINLGRDDVVQASYSFSGILIELSDPFLITKLYQDRPRTLLFKTYSRFNIFQNQTVEITVNYQ